MKKILIAYDDSPGAEAALLDLVRGGLADRCEAKVLTLADVWVPPDPSRHEPSFPDRLATSRVQARQAAVSALAAAREISTRGAERLRALFPAWTVQHAAHADSPAWGILLEAQRWHADLIVIGSHGRSPLQKFFLGSVSQKVAAEACCSVRVFRSHHRHSDPAVRVLVAVDGSPDSNAAVDEALARKWPADTKFQLLSVVDDRLKTATLWESGPLRAEHQAEAVEDWLPPALEAKAKLFERRRFQVTTHILEGDPKTLLLRHADAWQADCIFLGARGLQHGPRLYLGTFASAVTSRAHCTVEIVRPQITQAPAEPPREPSATRATS